MLMLLGCWGKTATNTRYKLSNPPAGWKTAQEGSADHAWYHKKVGGLMFVNSNCGRSFEDRPLADSLSSLLAGVSAGEVISTQELMIDNRAARMEIHEAQIDGVELQIAAVVLSKNGCLYDFVYTAPKDNFRSELENFISMTHSFKLRKIVLPQESS